MLEKLSREPGVERSRRAQRDLYNQWICEVGFGGVACEDARRLEPRRLEPRVVAAQAGSPLVPARAPLRHSRSSALLGEVQPMTVSRLSEVRPMPHQMRIAHAKPHGREVLYAFN